MNQIVLQEVFEVRQKIFRQAEYFFSKYSGETDRPDLVNELLDQSEKSLLKKIETNELCYEENSIPPKYFLNIFKNHVKNYSRKKRELVIDENSNNVPENRNYAEEFEIEILKKEVLKRLKGEDLFIFRQRLLGFSFEEISIDFNKLFSEEGKEIKETAIRTRFHRSIRKLTNQILGTQQKRVSK